MTGQHVRSSTDLLGQCLILTGHCLLIETCLIILNALKLIHNVFQRNRVMNVDTQHRNRNMFDHTYDNQNWTPLSKCSCLNAERLLQLLVACKTNEDSKPGQHIATVNQNQHNYKRIRSVFIKILQPSIHVSSKLQVPRHDILNYNPLHPLGHCEKHGFLIINTHWLSTVRY